MKMLIRSGLGIVLLFGLFLSATEAGPLKPGDVPADAKWAAHVDIEKLVSSELGILFRKKLDAEGDLKKIEAFSTIVEFDPFKDLHSITAFGTSYTKEEGVVLIKGRFEKKKLLALAQAEGELVESTHGELTVYEAGPSHERIYGSFYGSGTVVISNRKELLHMALDVLTGAQESLADGGGLRDLRYLPEGTIAAAMAQDFDKLSKIDPEAMILKKAERILIVAGERHEDAFVEASLTARDDTTASQVHQVLQGILAMGQLLKDKEPELAKLIKSLELNRDGKTITVKKTHPVEEVFHLLGMMDR